MRVATIKSRNHSQRQFAFVRLAVLLAPLLLGAEGWTLHSAQESLLNWIERVGFWGPVILILIYVLITPILLPETLFTLGAGFIYGVFQGTVYVVLGTTLGAMLSFLLARHVLPLGVVTRIMLNPKIRGVIKAVSREGWRIVLISRCVPFFPFKLSNYAFGLTSIPFWQYSLASLIGLIPISLFNVYVGSLAADLTMISGGHRPHSRWEWVALGVGFVVVIVFGVYVARIARKHLEESTHQD